MSRFGVEMYASGAALAILQQRVGVGRVLDRLQEDDCVTWAREILDQAALEAQVVAPVAKPGVLVGLGVGVDPDHARRDPRQDVRPVPLSAGEIRDAQAPATLRDPLVHRQVAAEPVVLVRHVRKRALAGKGEGRDAGGLVPLNVVQGTRRQSADSGYGP